MKRTLEEITEDLSSLERALGLIKRERRTVQKEWFNHPDNIRKQLELWKVPEQIVAAGRVRELLADYASYDGREEWEISLEVERTQCHYLAVKWGDDPWQGEFKILYGKGEYVWKDVRQENDGDLAKAIASMGFNAFLCHGEDSNLKTPKRWLFTFWQF